MILSPEKRHKTLFLIAGTRGGTGKTLLASNLAAYFRQRRKVRVRLFDLDPNPGGGLCRFYADCERLGVRALERVRLAPGGLSGMVLQGPGLDDQARDLLGLVAGDNEHSVFIIDTASGSLPQLSEAFKYFGVQDRVFCGLEIVLVIVVTEDSLSLENARPWLEFFQGQIMVVYNRPRVWGNGIFGGGGRDAPAFPSPIFVSKGPFQYPPLPLWLEILGGEEVVQLHHPNFRPFGLSQWLFNNGMTLYEAAYPYSGGARQALGEQGAFEARRKINQRVGPWSLVQGDHLFPTAKPGSFQGIGAFTGRGLSRALWWFHEMLAKVV